MSNLLPATGWVASFKHSYGDRSYSNTMPLIGWHEDDGRVSRQAAAVVDANSPTANMYGCEPCPRCTSRFRAPFTRDTGLRIECGDCGHQEPARMRRYAWDCPHDAASLCDDCAKGTGE